MLSRPRQNHYEAALSDLVVKGLTLKVLVRNDSPAPFAVPFPRLMPRARCSKPRTSAGGTEDDNENPAQLQGRWRNGCGS
jgi:hypothetical protein